MHGAAQVASLGGTGDSAWHASRKLRKRSSGGAHPAVRAVASAVARGRARRGDRHAADGFGRCTDPVRPASPAPARASDRSTPLYRRCGGRPRVCQVRAASVSRRWRRSAYPRVAGAVPTPHTSGRPTGCRPLRHVGTGSGGAWGSTTRTSVVTAPGAATGPRSAAPRPCTSPNCADRPGPATAPPSPAPAAGGVAKPVVPVVPIGERGWNRSPAHSDRLRRNGRRTGCVQYQRPCPMDRW